MLLTVNYHKKYVRLCLWFKKLKDIIIGRMCMYRVKLQSNKFLKDAIQLQHFKWQF